MVKKKTKKSIFIYVILFIIGSFLGFIIEKIGELISKNVTQGLFNLPIRPVYGFGLIIIYYVYKLKLNFWIKVLLSGILLTLLELVTGLIFLSNPLWDYSNQLFNFIGLIALNMSLIWVGFAIITLFILKKINK